MSSNDITGLEPEPDLDELNLSDREWRRMHGITGTIEAGVEQLAAASIARFHAIGVRHTERIA
jgi:hypothetical protein